MIDHAAVLPPFLAIDLETANRNPASACAIGAVRVDGNEISARHRRLIRPRTRSWLFSPLHGVTSTCVEGEPTFAEVWPEIERMLDGCAFLVAHNAAFDAAVVSACCRRARLRIPRLPYVCTAAIARDFLSIRPANLPAVCERLGIFVRHHDPLSDAEAAARILLCAADKGWRWARRRGRTGQRGEERPSGRGYAPGSGTRAATDTR